MQVVLLSGGLDSTTAMQMAHETAPVEKLMGVSFNYGQRHTRELHAAKAVCSHYGAGHLIIELPKIFGSAVGNGGSAIVVGDTQKMPHTTYQELAAEEGPSPTVVPFRNANLISMAVTATITHSASEEKALLWAGMHGEDARNWAYPDCTPEFLGPMAAAVYIGSYHQVQLKVPFQHWMKSDIVAWGLDHGVPYDITWSCYEGGQYHCGRCPTCIERKEAFRVNKVTDPVAYLTAL